MQDHNSDITPVTVRPPSILTVPSVPTVPTKGVELERKLYRGRTIKAVDGYDYTVEEVLPDVIVFINTATQEVLQCRKPDLRYFLSKKESGIS